MTGPTRLCLLDYEDISWGLSVCSRLPFVANVIRQYNLSPRTAKHFALILSWTQWFGLKVAHWNAPGTVSLPSDCATVTVLLPSGPSWSEGGSQRGLVTSIIIPPADDGDRPLNSHVIRLGKEAGETWREPTQIQGEPANPEHILQQCKPLLSCST